MSRRHNVYCSICWCSGHVTCFNSSIFAAETSSPLSSEQNTLLLIKLRNIINEVDFDPRIFLYIGDLAYNAGLKRIAISALFECTVKIYTQT